MDMADTVAVEELQEDEVRWKALPLYYLISIVSSFSDVHSEVDNMDRDIESQLTCRWWPWSSHSRVTGIRESSLPLIRKLDLKLWIEGPETSFSTLFWFSINLEECSM